jgi:hypothetical protein
MNMADEEEYVDFYDFSKAYENHPLLIKDDKQLMIEDKGSKQKNKGDDSADEDGSWEDCDMESMDSKEIEEEGRDVVNEEDKTESSF